MSDPAAARPSRRTPRDAGRPPANVRVRLPQPVLRRRIGSGRGATEQPNAVGDHPEVLTWRFWLLVVATGAAAGLFGALMLFVLHSVQHLAFSYSTGESQAAVEHVSDARRVVVLAIAGVLGGIGWFVIRRLSANAATEVHGTLWEGKSELSLAGSLPSALLSEVVIGMGASLGREQAPQLMGAVSGSVLGRLWRLPPGQRRLLVACGSGAGLAAVYNVPIGGALMIAELLYGEVTLTVVLPALVSSVVATAVGWIYMPNAPTYLNLASFHFSYAAMAFAVVTGLLLGPVAVGWTRLVAFVSQHRARGRVLLVAPLGAFLLLAVVALAYPQVLGNGKDMAHSAFLGEFGVATLGALFVLKPLVTALCLGSGAAGGLFTPTLSTGAMFGGLLAVGFGHLAHGLPVGAGAVIGAAAMLGAGLQAPLAGLVLMLELTRSTLGLAAPLVVATVLATLVARYLDGYSIYSSRLPARPATSGD